MGMLSFLVATPTAPGTFGRSMVGFAVVPMTCLCSCEIDGFGHLHMDVIRQHQ